MCSAIIYSHADLTSKAKLLIEDSYNDFTIYLLWLAKQN